MFAAILDQDSLATWCTNLGVTPMEEGVFPYIWTNIYISRKHEIAGTFPKSKLPYLLFGPLNMDKKYLHLRSHLLRLFIYMF